MASKKTKIILPLLLLLILLLAATAAYYFMSRDALMMRSPVLVRETPVITYMSGEVFSKNAPEEEWIEPEIGQKLKDGVILRSGMDGEMDIRLSADTLLKLDHDSVVVLEKSTLRNVTLELQDGRLYGRFHKLFNEQDLQVKTQTVVAGIRGTDLVFQAAGDSTTVYALSGITEVYNPNHPDDSILLSYQRKTEIKADSPPSQPERMSTEEVENFQNTINAIHKDIVFLVTRAIRFKANSADILPESMDELSSLLEQVRASKYTLLISGHTADVGSTGAQYRLSLARAQAVKDYLVSEGIPSRRLEVNGYGGSRPVADNESTDGRALNRRVEFIVIE